MNTFSLTLSSPDGCVFKGDAVMLTLRGAAGDLAVLAGHAPFTTCVVPCNYKIVLPDESEQTGFVKSGILTVSDNSAVLISGSFDQ